MAKSSRRSTQLLPLATKPSPARCSMPCNTARCASRETLHCLLNQTSLHQDTNSSSTLALPTCQVPENNCAFLSGNIALEKGTTENSTESLNSSIKGRWAVACPESQPLKPEAQSRCCRSTPCSSRWRSRSRLGASGSSNSSSRRETPPASSFIIR